LNLCWQFRLKLLPRARCHVKSCLATSLFRSNFAPARSSMLANSFLTMLCQIITWNHQACVNAIPTIPGVLQSSLQVAELTRWSNLWDCRKVRTCLSCQVCANLLFLHSPCCLGFPTVPQTSPDISGQSLPPSSLRSETVVVIWLLEQNADFCSLLSNHKSKFESSFALFLCYPRVIHHRSVDGG
jgi:hypothetical protein